MKKSVTQIRQRKRLWRFSAKITFLPLLNPKSLFSASSILPPIPAIWFLIPSSVPVLPLPSHKKWGGVGLAWKWAIMPIPIAKCAWIRLLPGKTPAALPRRRAGKEAEDMMTSNERDVKNTLISIATYAKALKSEGANLYSFVEDVDAVGIIEAALRSANITENSLRTYWGENLYTFVNTSNVFAPLVEALQKTHSGTMDVRSIVVCAANAFESFLADFAVRKGVSLSGRNGILQKRDALSAHISKKHRGMIEFVGQVRNAADHGADPDENNQVWTISNETARIYPCIIAALIKAIFSRDDTGSIEV